MNYYKKGYLFKLELFNIILKDLSILYVIWPLFHFGPIINKYPKFICSIFNILSEYGILVFSTVYILSHDLPISRATYELVQSIIHFFKMQSYTYNIDEKSYVNS